MRVTRRGVSAGGLGVLSKLEATESYWPLLELLEPELPFVVVVSDVPEPLVAPPLLDPAPEELSGGVVELSGVVGVLGVMGAVELLRLLLELLPLLLLY